MMPSSKALVDDVLKHTSLTLAGIGLRKRSAANFTLALSKDAIGVVVLNVITRQGDGMVHINPSIGVRRQTLEKSISELTGQKPHGYLPATISSALGYLTPEKQYGVFSFAREEDIGSTAESLAASINEYALPWMRENQELRTILHHLSNNQFTFLDAARLRVPVILSMLGEEQAASDMVQKNLAEVGMAEGPVTDQYRHFAHQFLARLEGSRCHPQ